MNQQLKEELDQLAAEAKQVGETLKATRIVAWAKNRRDSAIYKEMDSRGGWNDKTAAEKYRRLIANQLVRLYAKIIPPNTEPVRAYVHLASDASGYRKTEEVLDQPHWRAEVLNDALAKVGRIKTSFAYLDELTPFFARLDGLIAEYRLELATKRKTA